MKTPPKNWGKDSVSAFLNTAHENAYAFFVHEKIWQDKFDRINASFNKISESLDHSKDWIAGLFLLRCQSSFLGSIRLGVAGQIPEAFAIIRLQIESALYGFYFYKHPESFEIWLRRNEDEQSLKKAKAMFSFNKVLSNLEKTDKAISRIAIKLYERTIDYGAHPNEKSITSIASFKKSISGTQIEVNFLSSNHTAIVFTAKSISQVGLLSLNIFQRVFAERFKILGLDEDLPLLQEGL